jgi:hypothetical protein
MFPSILDQSNNIDFNCNVPTEVGNSPLNNSGEVSGFSGKPRYHNLPYANQAANSDWHITFETHLCRCSSKN